MRFLLLLSLLLGPCVQAQVSETYESLVTDTFNRAALGLPVSDSLLIAHYPTSYEQYYRLRAVMHSDGLERGAVQARDSLLIARLQAGNADLLRVHMRYAEFAEGDDLRWYYEDSLPNLDMIPLSALCEAVRAAVQEGDSETLGLRHEGYVANCESKGLMP